jgi:hypothetical protein
MIWQRFFGRRLLGFARNKLIHENIQLIPAKTVQQLRITHENHILAWQALALSSL